MSARGFWAQVDGHSVHVQGDADMPDETFAVLERMIRAAIAQSAPAAAPVPVVLRHPVTGDEQVVAGDATNRVLILEQVGYVVVQKE